MVLLVSVSQPIFDGLLISSIRNLKECGACITCNAMESGASCEEWGNQCLILSLNCAFSILQGYGLTLVPMLF